MPTIVVSPSEWSAVDFRRTTLRAARKQAKASRSVVRIKVQYPRRFTVLVATVDGR